jgi:uncharacterized protein (AIM24 family)
LVRFLFERKIRINHFFCFVRGDIVPIQLDGQTQWSVGKGGFLAMTHGVVKETKSQGLGKALFSGEGLFVHRVSGTGIIFVTSLGAIIQRQLRQGEQWIVDNGHLVAWNCAYAIERTGGGLISGMHAGEGLVCRFTGPGTVFIQVKINKTFLFNHNFASFLFFRHEIRKLYPNGFQVMQLQRVVN